MKLLIEDNEFIGGPPAPAKTWGEYFENVVTTSRLSGLRVSALAEDDPETNFGNMAQAVDCYGDGNVYRGQRSSDSKIPTLTINGMPAVEGPLSKAQRTGQESPQVEPVAWLHEFEGVATLNMTPPNYYGDHWKHTALYTAPPKRKPLTDEEMWDVIGSLADTRLAGPLEKLIRATERAHDIGSDND